MRKFLFLFAFISLFFSANLMANDETVAQTAPKKAASAPVSSQEYSIKDYSADSEPDQFYSDFANMLTTLALILGVLLFAAWLLRRTVNAKLEKQNETSHIRLVDRRNLTPRTNIFLIELFGKGYAILESQGGVCKIAEFDWEDDGRDRKEGEG